MSRALAAGGTKSPGVHVEGVWNSVLLSATAGRCLLGGAVPLLEGAFDSGTGVWHWFGCGNSVESVVYKTKSSLSSLTKESFNVQDLENVLKHKSYRVELPAILPGF